MTPPPPPPPPPPALLPPSAESNVAGNGAGAADPASHPLPPPTLAPPPTTWTAAEIAAARWPTPGGEPVWRMAPVADDYALSPAAAAAALAAPAGGAAGAAGAAPSASASASASAPPPLFFGYPHYAPEDRYVPRVQADGGVLSGAVPARLCFWGGGAKAAPGRPLPRPIA